MQKNTLKSYLPEIISLLCLIPYFLYLAGTRLISRDEGFYAMAARLVSENEHVYRDFFYPQMPVLPYIYGKFFNFFDISWASARFLTACIAIAIGLILVCFIKKKFGQLAAFLALFLYLTSNYVIAWFTVSQTYSLSVLFLLLSFCFISGSVTSEVKIAWSAIFFALAVQTRLFFLGLLPIFLLYIFFQADPDKKKKKLAVYILSLLITCTPSIFIALQNFDQFLFNNLGYHFSRTAHSAERMLGNKFRVAQVALGLVDSVKFSAWQLPLLIYTALLGTIVSIKYKTQTGLAVIILIALFILNLIPSPTYVQYFSTLIPFAIIASMGFVSILKQKVLLGLFIALFVSVYSVGTITDFKRYTQTGQGVIGIGTQENANFWNMQQIKNINSIVDKHCTPGKTVLSFWPGYILRNQCTPYPRSENHFGIMAAGRITKEQAEKYNVISAKDLNTVISEHQVDFIALGKKELTKKRLLKLLGDSGYNTIDSSSHFKLFSKTTNQTEQARTDES